MWLQLPLLFDLFIGGLMAGGCLLLLLGLRAERGRHVPSQVKQTTLTVQTKPIPRRSVSGRQLKLLRRPNQKSNLN